MRHTRWVRAFAVIFGVWFAVALAEPAALRACAQHGTTHDGGAASHGHRAQHHGGDGSSSPASGSHHQGCTCIGSCCAAAVTIIPPAVAVVIAETTTRSCDAVVTAPTAYRPSQPEHARPPSQGPPLLIA